MKSSIGSAKTPSVEMSGGEGCPMFVCYHGRRHAWTAEEIFGLTASG